MLPLIALVLFTGLVFGGIVAAMAWDYDRIQARGAADRRVITDVYIAQSDARRNATVPPSGVGSAGET